MKKHRILSLILVFILALSACGEEQTDEPVSADENEHKGSLEENTENTEKEAQEKDEDDNTEVDEAENLRRHAMKRLLP